MKPSMKRTAIAAAVASLCASPLAFAQEETPQVTFTTDVTETTTIDLLNQADVHIIKKSNVQKNVEFAGEIEVTGLIDVQNAALSLIDDKQITKENDIDNITVENAADLEDVGNDAAGQIAINVAAGDVNAQDNAVAFSAAVGNDGSADSEVFAFQFGYLNDVNQQGVSNEANLDNVLNNVAGVASANVTAGSGNLQKNGVALSVASGELSEANVWVKQEQIGLVTTNTGASDADVFGQADVPVTNVATLTNVLNGALGAAGLNLSAGSHNYQSNSLALSSN